MAARKIESEIDRLYQLAPDEFTAARNALAKSAGPDAAAVKRLTKPPIAAWAVNQVYWQHRDVYDALVAAAKELRQTHKAILRGRSGDLRSAGKAHETAVDQALKAALSLLAANGHPATDSTRQAIATTLRALPSTDPPGRLSATLQPGGFEMLAGLSIGSGQAARTPNKAASAGKEDGSSTPGNARGSAAIRYGTIPSQDHSRIAKAHRIRRPPHARKRLRPGLPESCAKPSTRQGAKSSNPRGRPAKPKKPRGSSSRRARRSPRQNVRSKKQKPRLPKRSERRPPPRSARKPPNERSRRRRKRRELRSQLSALSYQLVQLEPGTRTLNPEPRT